MKFKQNNLINLVLLFLFYFCTICVSAQITENSISQYQDQYPSSNKLVLNKEKVIYIELKDGDIQIHQNTITEDLFLNEAASQYSDESVSYSSFFELNEIKASSYNYTNGKYTENKVQTFREKDVLNHAFHDDMKSLNFIYPNLKKGSKTKLSLKETIHNPRFLSPFYLGDFIPILHAKLTIVVDNNIKIDFKEFNTNSIPITHSKNNKKNKTIYTWEVKNSDAIKMESSTPSYNNYFPHIIPTIIEYEVNTKTIKLASSVNDLYGWYYSLIKDLNSAPSNDQLVELVATLTKHKTSEIEKVRAIYYWVQNNVKYIAFEYGLGGFVPREANDVFLKRFGDCKDNSSILYEMLKIAGIKGNLTWIGTRKIPYSYNELPTPAVDNHMILSYRNNDNVYFLDATGRYIPLELPTSFIQGKEALIGIGDGNFKIANVPIIEPKNNKLKVSTEVSIKDNVINGVGYSSLSGYKKIDVYRDLEIINSDKGLKEYYLDFLNLGNNKFNLLNFQEKGKFNYDNNFNISFNFSIPDYLVKNGKELYINLNLDKKLQDFRIEDNRETDLEVDYKKSFEFINELTIPEGYTIEYIPENLIVKSDYLDATIQYQLKGNKIIYEHSISLNFLMLKNDDFDNYKSVLKKCIKAYKELIVLKEK